MTGRYLIRAIGAAALLLAGGAAINAAGAAEWKYTSWTPPSAVNNAQGTIPMFESIEKRTNGDFKIENFMGAQLFNNRTTLKGVGDGVADAGVIVPAFTPQELKHAAIITDAVSLFTDEWVTVPAANEALLLQTAPELMEDFHNNGTISLGVYGGGNLNMQCAIDIDSVDDLKGLKVAGVSSMTARWAEKLGAVRQQIGPGDLQPALERRQVDCTFSPLEFLTALSLKDVVKTIVDRPLGAFPAIHIMLVNQNSWKELSTEYKKLILEEMPHTIARAASTYYKGDAEGREIAKANGIKILDMPELDPLWDEFVNAEREKTIVELAAGRGVSAEVTNRVLNTHLDLLVKWRKIMDERGRNQEALAQAMWDEIFSKVDPDTL